ncbi:hypothetical protein N825_13085 [Skermanella stibiiresistens SB22]|uniref:DUF3618 domain-containing protein n=1 Tax=Skermanella stibiiresistens SB22 TaxID=1385369 RepID=W9H1B5_9PROT|nr:DUF3618 domain-containing protein [Skermanella stibiiresistens]EWY38507.1 hypothetical protein N825_13085 [Skermanella stibiiresistens SB22]
MANTDHRTPEQIEREIEQTRQNTAATLAAIEDRLSPGRLMDEVWSYLRTSGQGQTFVSNLSNTVRDNPIPVALLALSVAWLAVAGSRGDSKRGRWTPERADDLEEFDYDDAVLTEDAFHFGAPPRGHAQARHTVDYVDPDTHHQHVSSSRPGAPDGVAPTPDTLLGREAGTLKARDAARAFETPNAAPIVPPLPRP